AEDKAPPDTGEEEHGAGRARFDANRERAAGAMPVRVQIPRDGREMSVQRYWIDAGEPGRARFAYARTPLPPALEIFGVLLSALLVALAIARRAVAPRRISTREQEDVPVVEAAHVAEIGGGEIGRGDLEMFRAAGYRSP